MKSISRRHITLAAFALATSTLFCGSANAEQNAQAILASSDISRGGGSDTGLSWEVLTTSSGTNSEELADQRLRVKASRTSSLSEVLEPHSNKGSKMLQVDRNMWISKPGLKKPVAISARQRLSGQASVGDVAATNYAKDYTPRYLQEEKVGDEPCHVLELTSKNAQTTYDRINYWVSIPRGVAVKAEFLSLSGKKLKSAEFEYKNVVKVAGKTIPFVSKMVISDALTDAKTTLTFQRISTKGVTSSDFDVANLQ
jgi:outer membrane lipoprotein-sorting protein